MFQIVKRSSLRLQGAFHIYTPIYTLSMYTDEGLLFSRMGVLLGTRWERSMFSFDTLPPTHTTHTYTHKYGASFSVTLGVVTSADVCVLLQRAFTNDKACLFKYAFGFSISSFELRINNVFAVFSVVICLCLRQYAPLKHSSNVILVLSSALCHCPCVTCPTQSTLRFDEKRVSPSVTNVPRRFIRTYTT